MMPTARMAAIMVCFFTYAPFLPGTTERVCKAPRAASVPLGRVGLQQCRSPCALGLASNQLGVKTLTAGT